MLLNIQSENFKRFLNKPVIEIFFITLIAIILLTMSTILLVNKAVPSKQVIKDTQDNPSVYTQDNEMFYFFENKNNRVSCVIHIPNMSSINIMPFLEYIEVVGQADVEIKIDYHKSEVQISFKQNTDHDISQLIYEFIKKLKSMGLRELHENKNASWFYSNNDGLEILNDSNYTPKLLNFLKNEKNMFNKIIQENKNRSNYISLIEVGCGTGENLDIAVSNNLHYLGLDFSANKIIQFNKKPLNQLHNGYTYKAECLDIMDFLEAENIKKLPIDGKAIIIFPFNVFGNIAPISLLLSKLKIYNMDFMLSVYNNDYNTIVMREEYYTNCGYQNIVTKKEETGVLFKSPEGLYTIAYDKSYLSNLIQAFGFDISVLEAKYGFVIYAKSTKRSDHSFAQNAQQLNKADFNQLNEEVSRISNHR